jgi:Tfp pilus assembly protein PilF
LEPNQPNPHDSLAEILRQAGHLHESLAEYRNALKVDPKFYTSQLGLGDVYTLLGDQNRARGEYAKAPPEMVFFPELGLRCQTQAAITYARAGDMKQARIQLVAVLHEATKLQKNDCRSFIHQELALVAQSRVAAFQQLEKGEEVLRDPTAMSEAKRVEMLARILRMRARLAAEAGELELASRTVVRLQKMVQENPGDTVERAYNGAQGALLAAQSKTSAAIEALQEDPEDPFSMAKLVELQAASGDAQGAEETRARLKTDFGIALEDWLVARRFRQ